MFRFLLGIPVLGAILRQIFRVNHPSLERNLFGLNFPNPVGLAAGFDKDGKFFKTMSALGFGFIEIGTVTPLPQEGNSQPRLFRLPADKGLINRMGFNNEGMEAMAQRLKSGKPPRLVVGGNIGKNKATPNELAHEDYLKCFECLYPYVDYFVVNVSSPNTPNLRALQEKEPLMKLLSLLSEKNSSKEKPKPILLKIAPDLSETQLDEVIEIVQLTETAGIIATNTTISRDHLKTGQSQIEEIGNGGLSGLPVKDRSTAVIRYLVKKSMGKIPVIAVGGISSPADAKSKLEAGASLVQVYTGLIYEGPGLIKRINKSLIN